MKQHLNTPVGPLSQPFGPWKLQKKLSLTYQNPSFGKNLDSFFLVEKTYFTQLFYL